jgi:hypothetical protein
LASFLDGIRQSIRREFCTVFNADPAGVALVEDAFRGTLFEFSADRLNTIFCDREPGNNAIPPPPFSGGQCATFYNIQIGSWERYINSGCAIESVGPSSVNGLIGPISSIVIANPNGTGQLCPGSPGQTLRLTSASGSTNLLGFSPFGAVFFPSITIVRADAQPDDCGDPAIVLPTPAPITVNVDIEYGDNNEFNLVVPVIFGVAYFDVDGTVNIPITIDDLNLIGELKLNPSFDFDFNFGGNKPPSTDPDPPTLQPDSDGGEPDDGPVDERGDILGVFVVVTQLNTERLTTLAQSSGLNLLLPRAASVKFKVSANGRSGWTGDIPVKSSNAWVPVPGRVLASDVQVTPDFGSQVAFTALRERPQRSS